MNNLRQNVYPGVNLVGRGITVGKAQVVLAIRGIHEESLTCHQRYPFLKRLALYVLSKDILRQTEPDEKATRRVCPPHIGRHVPAQSG